MPASNPAPTRSTRPSSVVVTSSTKSGYSRANLRSVEDEAYYYAGLAFGIVLASESVR